MTRLPWSPLACAVVALSCGDGSTELTWTEAEANQWLSGVWGTATDDVYAVGLQGRIAHSRGGATWASTTLPAANGRPAPPALKEVGGTGRLDVWVVGADGTAAHSTNGGTTWTATNTRVDVTLFGLRSIDPNEVYAVGERGTILHTTDAGATWELQASPVASTLWSVWASGPDDVYVAGGDTHVFDADPPTHGVILRSTDRGATWLTVQPPGLDHTASVVWGSGPDNVFAAGSGGLFLRSRDSGRSWQPVTTGLTVGFGALGGDRGTIYLGGGLAGIGTILRSQNGGASFSVIKDQTIGMSSIWESPDGTVYAAGTGGLVIGRPRR